MEETKNTVDLKKAMEQSSMNGAIKMLVPTKVETTLTVPQLWNGLFSALFGTPHDIEATTGVTMDALYLAKFPDDEDGAVLKICYEKNGKEEIFDSRGALWRNMLKVGNDIFPGADMDIKIREGQVTKEEGEECSKEENTSSTKQED